MTFPLPCDTAHVRPHTRQYRLMRWDLGEGVERASLKVGALLTAPWLGVCYALGVPFPRLILVWLLPPLLLTHRAMGRDESGRLRLRGWADRADARRRSRSRPIVNGDTVPAAPAAPITARAAFLVVDLDDPRARPFRRFRRAQAL